jgi:uncharacterized protein involved in exopolysaccharide biosynthesis
MTQAQVVTAQIRGAFSVVWRHRFVVAKAFGLLLAFSLAIVAVTPRVYRAAATVLIVNGNSRNDPTLSPDIPALVTSTSVLAEVQKNSASRFRC